MNIHHNHPKSFFKYMSASTAEKVLKNRTLRWSHPSEFDDTLDVAKVVDEKMDGKKQRQIRDAIIDVAANISPNHKINDTHDQFKLLVFLLSLFGNDKTSAISELRRDPVDTPSIAELNNRWKKMRNDFRILCLGIEKDNHHLWDKYAEEHKGVVIELVCRKDLDSPWLIAKPVEYVPEEDLYLTANDWAEILILEPIKAVERIFEKCTLRKSEDNKHKWFEQNEWRVIDVRMHHETGYTAPR
jgi:hypothetical protein